MPIWQRNFLTNKNFTSENLFATLVLFWHSLFAKKEIFFASE